MTGTRIGETIRRLRREQDVTQEKLAEYLHISGQSVSKWELGTAMPDVSLIVPLANFFGVTTDELFGRREGEEDDEVEAWFGRSLSLTSRGDVEGNLALWEEAVRKYPKNYKCLLSLARALDAAASLGGKISRHQRNEYARRVGEIGERILADCPDTSIRNSAAALLVYLYGNPWTHDLADEEKAVKFAESAPTMYESREILLEHAWFTEENRTKREEQSQYNILHYLDLIALNLTYSDDEDPRTRAEKIETALALWNTLIPDGNFLFYHSHIAQAYEQLAERRAEAGEGEKAFEALRKAFIHARAYDALPDGEQRFTAPAVCLVVSDKTRSAKNYTETETELLRRKAEENPVFKDLRRDPRFGRIFDGEA